jgi:Caspase domain
LYPNNSHFCLPKIEQDYIVNVHGFSESPDDMALLLDEDGYTAPTFANIIDAFKKLSEESQPGDAVFVQFSGHGGRVLDSSDEADAESYDEVIVPLDYKQAGLIRDTLVFKTLLAPMRFGITVTVMIDCCDTGMLLELPYSWTAKSDKKDVLAKLSANDDFSFVRFLKVVKTLYESSTFTQLGKTVGFALHPLSSSVDSNLPEEEPTKRSNKKNQKKSSSKSKYNGPTSDSILEALTEACTSASNGTRNITNDKTNQPAATTSENLIQRKDNIFDQMIKGCTLLGAPEDDFSDDETFKTRTEDELSTYSEVGQSYETMTDDEQDRARRRRR